MSECACVRLCAFVCVSCGWFDAAADGFRSVCNVIWDGEISLFRDLC